MSATTNAGFQIKSIYEDDHTDFRCGYAPAGAPCKNDITTLHNVDPYFTSYNSGWSNANPRYIKAINNSVEYCPPTSAIACSRRTGRRLRSIGGGHAPHAVDRNTTVSIVPIHRPNYLV